jgi:flagellar biosynthesis/type III secretory pathway protein FliH
MFKAAALGERTTGGPFVAAPVPPAGGFSPDARFAAAAVDTVRLREELAGLSPVGAVLEEELRSPAVPVVDVATVRAEGFAAGRKAAALEHAAELEAARRLAATSIDLFDRQLAIDADVLSPRVEALVLALARAVIGDELTATPQSIRARVEAALAELDGPGAVEIRIHPEDAALLQADADRWQRVQLVASASVGRGDFELRRGDGAVVDRIVDRIARIERAVSI